MFVIQSIVTIMIPHHRSYFYAVPFSFMKIEEYLFAIQN